MTPGEIDGQEARKPIPGKLNYKDDGTVNALAVRYIRSENRRKFALANRRPHNWKLYSSRLPAESNSGHHWPDRQHTVS